jgi:hypothetical protein
MSKVTSISRLRFDALAGYTRKPSAAVVGEELAWYAHSSGRFLGVLIRDRTDNDYGGIVLGRDENQCFRCVDLPEFDDQPNVAEARLLDQLEAWSRRPLEDSAQRDKSRRTLDLFTPIVVPSRLSDAFVRLASAEGFSPAREMIQAMIPYYEDVDGNFVEQFQSTGFDSRFWELYLFALLAEQGFVFDRTCAAPDFLCEGLIQDIFVEAVTVNPSRCGSIVTEPPAPTAREEIIQYLKHYMPIKWGSALTSKLAKKYWMLPHVGDRPIVLAIQDFHVPRSMTFTHSTLPPYLYGLEFSAYYDSNGDLQVKGERMREHIWKEKCIESGFFYLAGAEMISAVIQNPTATLSKFNRMGRLASFGSSAVHMMRSGTAYNPDPTAALPLAYQHDLNSPDHSESWCEGLNVFHNPRARYPLAQGLFPEAMHHRLKGGRMVNTIPPFHPFTAETLILSPKRIEQ